MLAPALLGLTIAEYAPNAVKKTVVGAGDGDKGQIRAMVKCLLPRAAPDSADAADALAIAITHAHSRSWAEIEAELVVGAGEGSPMIGKLTGRLDQVSLHAVIVDVGGVGYEVTLGARTLTRLPPIGQPVSLAIETHVREDEISLYRLHHRARARLVPHAADDPGSGRQDGARGARHAVAEELANAIALQDWGGRAGAGRRHEARPAHRRRAQGQDAVACAGDQTGGGLAPVAVLPEGLARRDAVSALTNLGYAHGEAAAAVSAAIGKAGREARTEELIRLGLRELAQ